MKALVVGYGSIGQRHSRLLTQLGCNVAVVSRRPMTTGVAFGDTLVAIAAWKPAYVVVANRTEEHRGTVEALVGAGYRGRVMVEKPLFDWPHAPPAHEFALAAVAYNLRFDPVLAKLKALLAASAHVSNATIYVGSYLPDWRPSIDYRQSYSAIRAQGGGVLRDLSHELDYAQWLFGRWRRLTASGGHLSQLEIDSDDVYTLLLETELCSHVVIHMNYLDRQPRREILVNADGRTYHVDLVRHSVSIDGARDQMDVERDDTFRAEHRAALSADVRSLCSFGEAIDVLVTVEAAERAARSHLWLER